MEEFMSALYELNNVTVIIRIVASAVLGGLIGSERGRHGRAAGLRTHILVCVGAALTAMTGMFLSKNVELTGDVARLSAQVISGIGFLGAGMIMIRNSSVITGLTTAAGMWTTAAIGIAMGYGFYIGALVSTVICIFSVTVLSHVERKRKNAVCVYIEIPDISYLEMTIKTIRESENPLNYLDIIPAKSGYPDHVGVLCILNDENKLEELNKSLNMTDDTILTICDINF